MAEFFLALVFLADGAAARPQPVAPFSTLTDCALAAQKANALPQVNTPEAKAKEAIFLCFQFVDTTI